MDYMRNIKLAFTSALILAGSLVSTAPAALAQTSSSLPAPWSSQDIGSPALAGSATLSSGTFTIKAAGVDIWGTSDQFHFVYQTMTGDGEIVARVDSVTAASAWSKAGVMMRETLTKSSKHEFALVSAANGVALQRRVSTGGSSYSTAGTTSAPPRWVRLVRKGTTFQAYESADGQTWRSIGSSTATMASTIYVGVAATSRNSGATTTAKVSNVIVRTATAANQLPSVSLSAPANGATYSPPAAFDIQASASDADGTISRVDFYGNSTLIGSDTSAPYTFSVSNVPAGSYTLTAVATDNLGGRTTSAARTVTVSDASGSVPAPWTAQDVGSPAVKGSTSESGGTFTVSGAGADIWGTADQFQFVYQQLTGDGEIVARVQSLTPVNAWSKAGVMMRESLAAGSKHASSLVSSSNGMTFQRRTSTSGTSLNTYGSAVSVPYWVRLVRKGDAFEAYESSNGSTWRLIGSQTISMLQTIYVGLAVTSHNTTTATTAAFSNVTVSDGTSTNQPPTATLTAPANGATYATGATVTLSATASDSDGTIARVDFYRGSTLIASDTTSPYAASWASASAGTYTLTAVATDNGGQSATSNAVGVTVGSSTNTPPAVSITSPVSGAWFCAPTTVALTASASDSNGSVTKVDFYAGTTLIGTDTTSPYSVNWANPAPGTYSLTARATDNGGAVTTSTAVSVTLRPSQAAFTASPDHATVTSYRLDIFLAGTDPATATPKAAKDLGKPTPVNGDITVDITSTLQPLVAGSYIATVTAISPGGSTRSAPSGTFTR
jgi:regulation of enolase protein 1 (concanavalin A-like superfamily)